MPMKGSGRGECREIDRRAGGVGWIAHPEETMQRASHALAVGGTTGGGSADGEPAGDADVWLVDPVDAEGLDALLAPFGDVAGVVTLLDRHERDAAALARRHGVSAWVPSWMGGVAASLDAPVERFDGELADTGYRLREVVNNPVWKEGLLYDEDDGVAVIPEAVGTASYFRARDERLGVHPMLRLLPPRRAFRELAPDRVLVGHGAGIERDATAALRDALDGSRRRAPGAYAKAFRDALSG
jgi:hypothetical protein